MSSALPLFSDDGRPGKAANILAAARALLPTLNRSRPLDRRVVANVMTTSFGGTDAEGAWSWRDAYDAQEAALVLQIRRLAPQVGRLEDGPAEICALLTTLSALTLSHTRRSENQVALDQFSTPPELAAIAVAAAQVRPGDRVLEPSAGIGLMAVVAEACGAGLVLNEIDDHRAGLLDGLFTAADRSRFDAVQLADRLPASGTFHAVVMNPPFQHLERHLHAGLAVLADGGRLSAIVPARLFEDRTAITALAAKGGLIAMIRLPAGAFARHGTSVEVGLLVMDRVASTDGLPEVVAPLDLAEAARHCASLPARPTAQPRTFRQAAQLAVVTPRARTPSGPTRLRFLAETVVLDYETRPWTGEGRDVGLYQAYAVSRVAIAGATAHPAPLVESAAMGSTAPPAPTYRPVLPKIILDRGLLSDAQLEMVIYAGEAHAVMLPGWWTRGDQPHQLVLVPEGTEGAFQVRRGFFLGDATGVGKGRQIAAVIADNMAQGRVRAVWISKNEDLLEDARRDWTAIGGAAADIVPQSAWKQGETIGLDGGVLFTTYATLRQPARGDRPSRLDQIVAWLGEAFDGVIVPDEAHALANAAGGGEGVRGAKKASQQGMAGLALQNRLPNARVMLVSATGATTPANLSYAPRLGLWGGPEAPFNSRDDFMDAVVRGGVAVMELIARELKALGLYAARSLSFDGVEYEPLRHELTPQDAEIWDAWADAFQIIHSNLRAALEAVGVCDDKGVPKNGLAASVPLSAFASTSQRFFNALLCGLKAPTLVASIRRDHAEGRSAVVQIVSTLEAVMERRLAQIPPEEWSNLSIDLTPKDTVLDYLAGAFPLGLMDEVRDDDGAVVSLTPVLDEHGAPVLSQEALRLRDACITHLACLPAVPGILDSLLEAFGTDQVAEITGRSRRVVVRNGRRSVERRSRSAARAETDAFMAGLKRTLVFSEAGGTGRSYHADRASRNTQRRRHYLAEAGWRADMAVQGLGRTHRTNQESAPLFTPVMTDIKGEKRFLSTIARRLDSLGALTKGERRTAGNGLFRAEDNLESPFARRALQAFYVALHSGEVPAMDRETFETKTALRLVDRDGALLEPDDLPPMHTFLNRLLALRIADQNALFETFETLLGGILERAEAAGHLDHGVEDIVAEELEVVSEEVIRTDAATGAETRLVRFAVRTRRELLDADAALDGHAHLEPEALDHVVNGRSGGVALVTRGLTATNDQDRLVPAVRLTRPESSRVIPLAQYEESAWEIVDLAAWRAAWKAEIAAADPWRTRELILVTGLLLPIWKSLPPWQASVRRLKAPDGRRWLGRVLEPVDAAKLKVALGLSDAAAALGDGAAVSRMIVREGASLALAGGFWLRRARVMDRWRIEVVNAGRDRQAFVLLGCFVEIIAYQPRVFVPVDRPTVLEAVLARHPAAAIEAAAA
ncbi:strawberry notch-like NTP hydrolase domain-containing protein (plasmid) [Brevundimonas staleyi]|uniref:Strawberry notch-like NTP hydrolase domain-containing protein n=1 Tax=Brevundimonas staleyi TaxID=74326 RepID=A0ABW0FMF6_9CAUL